MFETPHYVSELYMKKEDLRILRENVLLVVRDYNRYVPRNCMWHEVFKHVLYQFPHFQETALFRIMIDFTTLYFIVTVTKQLCYGNKVM